MKVVRIAGSNNSGKTTTLEYLVRDLTYRGYRVITAKDFTDTRFSVDKEGRNTMRHRVAGSQLVIARGIHETGFLYQRRLSVREMLEGLDFDYCVLEGFDNVNLPTIVTLKDLTDADRYINENTFAISGVVANTINISDFKGIPVYNGILESRRLTDLVIEKVGDYDRDEPSLCD